MRLLIDAHCFDYKTTEGVNTYLRGLYTSLIPMARDITFYVAAADIENARAIFGCYDNVVYIKLNSRNKLFRLLFEFAAIVKKYDIDLAHYQYISPIIHNCKSIVTLHDILFVDYPNLFPWSYRFVKGLMFKYSAKRADLLLTVSEYSRRQISKHYDIPCERIAVTPNAVDSSFYCIDYDSARDFVRARGIDKYILYVGRIEPRKNQLALLKAYCRLKLWNRGYSLVFIGRKSLAVADFEEYMSGLSDDVLRNIHLINQVTYQRLQYWYRASSLFVFASLAEGFGIPAIEAAAVGVPCICSNKTAMKDFTFFGDRLVDTADLDVLCESIEKNLRRPKAEQTEQARGAVIQKYNWNNIAKNFYNVLIDKFADQ